MKIKLILFLLVNLFAFSLFGQETNVNGQIVLFCEQHLNQKVGNGECFALASQALREAGLTRNFADNPAKGDYVWGKLILYLQGNDSEPVSEGQMENIAPGDIIQFRDSIFKRKGKSDSFGHHTAVVEQVSNNGSDVKLLQQNFSGKEFVTELNLHLPDLKAGWIRVYEPTQSEKRKRKKN